MLAVDQAASSFSYAAIIDAGSTSSRVFIYSWETDSSTIGQGEPVALRTVFPSTPEEKKAAEADGGIQHKEKEMQGYLTPPLSAAQAFLRGKGVRGEIPLYLLATGGMREESVSPEQRERVLKAAYSVLTTSRFHGTFGVGRWEDDHVRVISGRVEGLFGWVALNYGRGVEEQISGLLELGGASMQMAYKVPDAQVKKEKICLLSGEHRVYSQTWDGFGADSAMRVMLKGLVEEAGGIDGAGIIRNPCLPRGQAGAPVVGSNRTVVGSGEFSTCLQLARGILKDGLQTRDEIPSYLDIASYSKHFYGVSNYWYNYQFFAKWGGYDVRRAYDRKLFTSAVDTYCSGSWNTIQWSADDRDRDSKYTANRCFYTAWMLNLLHDDQYGFGLEMTQYDTWRNLLRFPTTNNLASRSSWTIGAAALVATHGELTFCPKEEEEEHHFGLVNVSYSYYPVPQQAQVEASSSSCRLVQPATGTLSAMMPQDNILIHLLSYVVILVLGYQAGQMMRRRRERQTEQKEKDARMAFVA